MLKTSLAEQNYEKKLVNLNFRNSDHVLRHLYQLSIFFISSVYLSASVCCRLQFTIIVLSEQNSQQQRVVL